MSKVYEETYLNRWIEIYCFSQFAPGGVGSSHFFARIDDWQMPGTFDHRSHNPNRPSDNTDNQSPPETSSALVAARAYCDSEADALIRRSNEQMHLTLSYREAKTLLRAMRFAFKHEQIATHDLQKRIELLLQEPSAVELTHKTNSLSRTLMKIRRFVGITKNKLTHSPQWEPPIACGAIALPEELHQIASGTRSDPNWHTLTLDRNPKKPSFDPHFWSQGNPTPYPTQLS